MGMPMTGSSVSAEVTPARWAAPPAAAITTRNPAPSSSRARPPARFGVRWAERTRASNGTWRDSRTANAFSMRGRSESLPTRISTRLLIVVSPFGGADGSGLPRPASSKRGFQCLPDRRDPDRAVVQDGGDPAVLQDDRLGRLVLHAEPLRDGVRDVAVGQQVQVVELAGPGMAPEELLDLLDGAVADAALGRMLVEHALALLRRQRALEVGQRLELVHKSYCRDFFAPRHKILTRPEPRRRTIGGASRPSTLGDPMLSVLAALLVLQSDP